MLERLRQMLIKELIHLFRDPHARFSLIAPPIIQMLIFGYAATYEVNHVATAIIDMDHSQESRDLISHFTASNRFNVSRVLDNESQISHEIDRRHIALILQIHPGFAEDLRKGQTARIQAVFDGTDSNTALIALGYVAQIADRFAAEYRAQRLDQIAPSLMTFAPKVRLDPRPWYNPNLDGRWFFVPGTIGTLLMTTVITLTAFAVVREREIGTLEQLMVTPIRPVELILGKTLPALLVALGIVAVTMTVAVFWFAVPFRGSLLTLLAGTVVFGASALGVGLVISTVSSTQQQAFATAFFYIMPAIMLSGFSYPISSMPRVLQYLTYIDPLRFFLVIVRSTFLKASGLDVVWPELLALTILSTLTLGIATMRFHKTLD